MILTSIARILQGSAVGGISVVILSYIPLLFPDNIHVAVSYLEMSIGVGMSIGILIGNILSGWLSGPHWVFIGLGLIYPLVNYLLLTTIPDSNATPRLPINYTPFIFNFKFLNVFFIASLGVLV